MKKNPIAWACLAGALAHSACLAVVLPVQQDTASSSSGALTLTAGRATSLSVTSSRAAFVQFDLTKLPPGVTSASFRSARLRVYASKVRRAGNVHVYLVGSGWSEIAASATPAVGSGVGTFLGTEMASKKFLVADVSAAVAAWLGGTTNHGLAIKAATTPTALSLSTKEGSSTGYPAELEIDYAPDLSSSVAVGIGTNLPIDCILDVEGDMHLNDWTLFFRGGTDRNHGVGWFGPGKSFANVDLDGPALYGFSGGALGTRQETISTNIALYWNANGNVVTPGLLAQGSGTGTSEAPDRPNGLVTRRIKSTNKSANQVVARFNKGTLERDGSNAGFILRYVANPGRITITAMGINSLGLNMNAYQHIDNPGSAGTTTIFTDLQGVVFFRCQFGDVRDQVQEHTEVSISRTSLDHYWAGFVTSTFNQ